MFNLDEFSLFSNRLLFLKDSTHGVRSEIPQRLKPTPWPTWQNPTNLYIYYDCAIIDLF